MHKFWSRSRFPSRRTPKSDRLLGERRENRDKLAAAIEEEKSYAWFHGYAAYRFGYRADVITTWALMKDRFGGETGGSPCENSGTESSAESIPKHIPNKPEPHPEQHGYWLLLEDMSLNFPDKESDIHLLHLEKCCSDSEGKKQEGRAFHCPRLDSTKSHIENSEHRILITTGQTGHEDNRTLRENRNYLRRKAQHHGLGKVVLKPSSGLFDLWKQCGLLRKTPGTKRLGNAQGFAWPPPARFPESGKSGRHGAPGRLLSIADKLIERAEGAVERVTTVGDAVWGAVLATDALELTGGRVPTTAIESLSLKHRFEVLAECQFSGVEHHIETNLRMDEIRLETETISHWFDKSQRKKAALNGQMHILNEVVRVLREHNQFDEEQVCVRHVRELHTTLWMRKRPWRYVFFPFIRYVELLLASFPQFLIIVAVWLSVLAVLFALALPDTCGGAVGISERVVLGLESAITSFFSIGSPIYHDVGVCSPTTLPTGWVVLVSSLAIMSGFLHLGVLITHLYTLVSRR